MGRKASRSKITIVRLVFTEIVSVSLMCRKEVINCIRIETDSLRKEKTEAE